MSALAGKQELHAEVGKLVETQLARIAEIAKAKPEERFTSLVHLINEQTLMESHRRMEPGKVPGVDGVTKREYEANLEANLKDLVARMKRQAYKPQPALSLPMSTIKSQLSNLNQLAVRNAMGQWVRTLLTALAVGLGVMMIPAADVIGSAVRNAGQTLEQSERAGAFVGDYLDDGLQTVGLVILAAAAFLVFNAFAMSITQRQRQIGALRALGATRGQVMRLVLGEAFLIGLGGTVLGLLLGPLVGRGVITLLGEIASVAHGESTLTAQSVVLAAVLGIGVTLVSVLIPAWRAATTDPDLVMRS